MEFIAYCLFSFGILELMINIFVCKCFQGIPLMGWLLVITAFVVIWVASLCKILHVSVSSYRSAFLNSGDHGLFC